MPHLDELQIMLKYFFPNELFLFITEEIKLNTVIVEGGYMFGIPEIIMYKSKFTGC